MKSSVLAESRWEGSLDALRAKDWNTLRAPLLKLYPSDVADMIIELPSEEEGIVFRLLPRDRSARVFGYLPSEHQEALLHALSRDELKLLLDEIPPDDRTRLFEELPPEVTRRLLESLSPVELLNACQLLGYPENIAGRFMTPKYVAVPPGMTAAQALGRIRSTGKGKETKMQLAKSKRADHQRGDTWGVKAGPHSPAELSGEPCTPAV